MKKDNLWILTEERPKDNVIGSIFEKFAKDFKITCFINTIRILPMLDNKGFFLFTYEVKGLDSNSINKVYIKTVSGFSSFVDFLVFRQIPEPTNLNTPIYAIEETKTDDSESRNTGVYQRASKFVYLDYFYPNVKKIILYSLRVKQKEIASATNIFGTRCFLTLGIEILGKKIDKKIMTPFSTIDELINEKNSMRQPPKGNVPVKLYKSEKKIQISGRLIKKDSLSHDPNIGALSLISATLRILGWDKKIEIIEHGLEQRHINSNNKFIQIANKFNITFDGLIIKASEQKKDYWHYDLKGEKLGTIFIHLVIENFTNGISIYENHAGCERGYFITKNGESKSVLRKILYTYVPKKLIERPKASFGVPVGDWLRTDLKNWADNLLSEDRLKKDGIFHSGPIRKLWFEHLEGKRDWTPKLWSILMFQAWLHGSKK